MTSGLCPFCDRASLPVLCENELAFAIQDKFPVRPLHSLILPKRHAFDIFDTTIDERECMHRLADALRGKIMRADPSVGGFNFGSNIGAAAGQKIFHAHLHLIPRRAGDTPPPPARHG
jgi:diadenosine tetraphosphate (Ap4A) HIT family hydrolase